MSELSENARIVAGSTFGFSPGASIRYQMVESVPSPEMQAALDELVAAGIVIRDDETHGPVKYTASKDFDFTEYRKEAWQRMEAGTAPSIRMAIKRGAA